jgi:hypothetical protein
MTVPTFATVGDDLVAAFVEAALEASANRQLGDQLARLAVECAARARARWAAAAKCMDAAERCARALAASDGDPDVWPTGIEAEIHAALDARDEREAAA